MTSEYTYFDLLEKSLRYFINKLDLPKIERLHISNTDTINIRKQLRKASDNDKRLEKQLIKLLMKSRISEIEDNQDKHDKILITMKLIHCNEVFEIQARLADNKWEFVSLTFVENTAVSKLKYILIMIGLVMILVIFFTMKSYIPANLDKYSGREPELDPLIINELVEDPLNPLNLNKEKENVISIEQIKELAEQEGYLVIKSEEYEALLVSPELSTKEEVIHTEPPEIASKVIQINPGMSGEEVSRLLEKEGLVENNKEFNNMLKEMNVQSRIRTGKYAIIEDSTYVDIIKIITNK